MVCYYFCMQPTDRVHLYRCPYCTKKFYSRGSGVSHIRERHKKRLYDQSYFGASFFDKEVVWQKEELESTYERMEATT